MRANCGSELQHTTKPAQYSERPTSVHGLARPLRNEYTDAGFWFLDGEAHALPAAVSHFSTKHHTNSESTRRSRARRKYESRSDVCLDHRCTQWAPRLSPRTPPPDLSCFLPSGRNLRMLSRVL